MLYLRTNQSARSRFGYCCPAPKEVQSVQITFSAYSLYHLSCVCVCVCLCADCFVEDMQNYAIREFIGTALQCEFTAREGDFIYRLIKIGFWKGGPTMMIFCSVLETN